MSKAEPSAEELWHRVTGRKSRDRQISATFPDMQYVFREDVQARTFYDLARLFAPHIRDVREPTLEERVRTLEKEVQKLKHADIKNANMEKINEANVVYESFRKELEEKHFGKIVAIDVYSKRVVGIGNNVMEAYKDALKNSKRRSFSYKRVGSTYVYKLR